MNQRCPFCHEDVPPLQYKAHLAQHTKLRDDGQMTDHVTVAPAERYQGDLKGVPMWYRHEKCGAVTGMPEEIIRSYLADPFLYSDYSFCTGCGKYPHVSEFQWVDTGENLHAYNRRLRVEYIERNKLNPDDFVWKNGAPERRKRKMSGLMVAAGCLAALVVTGGLFTVAAAGAGALLLRGAGNNAAPNARMMPGPPDVRPPSFDAHDHALRNMEDARRRMNAQQDEMRRRMEQQQEEMRRRMEERREQMLRDVRRP